MFWRETLMKWYKMLETLRRPYHRQAQPILQTFEVPFRTSERRFCLKIYHQVYNR